MKKNYFFINAALYSQNMMFHNVSVTHTSFSALCLVCVCVWGGGGGEGGKKKT